MSTTTLLQRPPEKLSTRRSFFLAGGVAAAGATTFLVSDQCYNFREKLGYSKPSLAMPDSAITRYIAEFNKECALSKGRCHEVAAQVVNVANNWIKNMEGTGQKIPSYINPALVVKITGFESVMYPRAKKGSYEGLAQFSRRSGKFLDIKMRVRDYINRQADIQAYVLALVEAQDIRNAEIEESKQHKKPHSPSLKIERKASVTLEDLIYGDIFLDPEIQIPALMFDLLDGSKFLEEKHLVGQLQDQYLHTILYLNHQAPALTREIVVPHLSQETSIAELANLLPPKERMHIENNFSGNSGLYVSDGAACPLELVYRATALLQQPFRLFYKGSDKDDYNFKLRRPPTVCMAKRSFLGWLTCQPGLS